MRYYLSSLKVRSTYDSTVQRHMGFRISLLGFPRAHSIIFGENEPVTDESARKTKR